MLEQLVDVCINEQEAELSQTDRPMLCVIEYFAKSLKEIRNNTLE